MRNILREKRIAAGYKTVKAFTRAIGINNGTYWNWENGHGATTYSPKSALIAKKVCDAFNMSDTALKEAISNNYQAKLAGKMEPSPRVGSCYAFKKKKVSTVLSDWRMKEQLPSNDVAELLGVSQRTYLDWENGIHKPIGDNLKNLMDLTGLSMHQIASIYVSEEPKQEVSYVEKSEEPTAKLLDSPLTLAHKNEMKKALAELKVKEKHEEMDEVITERDENGKPVAGRYIFEDSDGHAKLTREGKRKVAEYTAKLRSQLTAASMAEDFVRQKALNEPHDFRDEVIDEVLEKMYGQMDYKKYVYLVGLLGR